MKRYLPLFFLLFANLCLAQSGTWTWMAGPGITSAGGAFGTQGVPSVNNYPPSVYGAYNWTDLNGNCWLYGGNQAGGNCYGDLWMFNPITLEWTWVKGNGSANPSAVTGTLGVPNLANTPGGLKWCGCSWVDTTGNLWLFGGNSQFGVMNHVWKYTIGTNEWTRMWTGGSTPVYGTKGVPSATNSPGGRDEMGSQWVDLNGKFWLYGARNSAYYADMWMFDPVTLMWTWMAGSQATSVSPVYGTKGVFSPANTPGTRCPYGAITENNGKLLLYGGTPYSFASLYADLWEYDPAINQWAWISGSNSLNAIGLWGTPCQKDTNYYPPARAENRAAWKDCAGNMWMYGGITSANDPSGDMWVYVTATRQWARLSNSAHTGTAPVYGTKGVPTLTNHPGARYGANGWKDKNNNFWIFGGFNSSYGSYSDMWRYQPDTNCVKTSCGCVALAGIIGSTRDTVCQGSGQVSMLSVSGSSGSLQWISSTNGINYSAISGATSTAYSTPGSLAQTTYYRVVAGGPGCNDSSVAKKITIVQGPVAGLLASSKDSICEGTGLTTTLTATGSQGSLQWQSSMDSLSFSNLPGATSAAYTTPPTLTQTMYYRVIAANGNCPPDSSLIIAFHILPSPVASFTETVNGKQVTFNSSGSSFDVTTWSWDFGDGSSSTQQNPVHTYAADDTFSVCLTVYNGSNCSYTLCKDIIIAPGVGIHTPGNGSFQVRPNPVSSQLIISLEQSIIHGELIITDLLGRELKNISATQKETVIDVSDLAASVYFVTLKTTEGSVTRKFVKE